MIRLLTKSSSGISTFRTVANARFLSQTNRMLDKPSEPKTEPKPATSDAAPAEAGPAQAWQKKTVTSQLTAFDRKVLVWSGKYKSVDEVPPNVARETLDRARDRFRVKSCIYMMLVCVVLCIVQVVRGKQAAGRGESVVKSNLEWHRQYNEAAKQGDDAPK